MPYYSVYISGGADQVEAGKKARNVLGGKAADYTGGTNLFYVQRTYDKATLGQNVRSVVGNDYEVIVRRISKAEFFGR
jgi:hypothetical protein